MNALRVALCGVSLVLLAAASPAAATTTIDSADYSAGSDILTAGSLSLGAGTYQFSLSFTDPVGNLFGFVEKTTTTNDVCDLGDGEFDCGGDDVFIQPLFEPVTPQLYQLTMRVDHPSTITWPLENIVVRQTTTDSCCTYQFGFTSGGAGHYVLSYAAVPEPAVWAMMLVGFGAIGFAARRRSSRGVGRHVTS